jgi:hypothetical protein
LLRRCGARRLAAGGSGGVEPRLGAVRGVEGAGDIEVGGRVQ